MTHITLGQVIWSSVRPIIKIYFIIGAGFGLARMGILTAEATRSISDIVLTILLPSLSFNKIVANIEDKDIKMVGIICLTSALVFGTGLGFAFIIRQFMPVPKKWRGGILAGGMFPNISDLPIAYLQTMDTGFIFTAAEGEKGVANVIIFLACFLFCVFNLGGFRLIENDFNYKDEESAVHPEELEGNSLSDHADTLDNGSSSSSDEQILETKKEESSSSSSATPNDANNDNEVDLADVQAIKKNISHTQLQRVESSAESISTERSTVTSIDSHVVGETLGFVGNAGSLHSATQNSVEARRTRSQPIALTAPASAVRENDSGITAYKTTSYQSLRSIDARQLPTQTMDAIINEYSNVDQFGQRRRLSISPEVAGGVEGFNNDSHSVIERIKSSNLTRILTSDATVSKKDIEESGSSLPNWIQKFPLTPFIVFFLKNCLRPCAMAVIAALIIAFIPWVKALFVTTPTTPKIKQAPDEQPALAFIMDFTSYVGAASVPFGLLLLGATLGRLKIGKLYPGFWKSAVLLVFLRQCIMPIFGVLWCDRLVKAGWVNWEDDKMLLFVIAITWSLPTMTTLIYFTASYTPLDCDEPIQMECVSFFLMIQYPLMAVALPFLVSYFLKVQMKV
ncbi:hypothetical protein NCAS_0B06740 [Naumovozyma castellii]|uniref:Protein ECM3 n=1 Tax=Naumovozyma castellii TaxID=27288 RepID=G0VA28_NAUCA|nr:hypothetical protein NCAS_0B06740 [Naumovozyma castellii CBS 4309]CCC68758.1 hypothetical protein NCAS_0B06740 [Naumovozyma castellii CBS 4309]